MGRASLQRMTSRGVDSQGRSYWRIRGPDPETGRRTTLDSGRWTEDQADRALELVEARLTLGLRPERDTGTVSRLGAALSAYTEWLAVTRGEDPWAQREGTRAATVDAVIGRMPLERVTPQALADYALTRSRQRTRHGTPPRRSYIADEIATCLRALRHVRDREGWAVEVPTAPRLHLPDDRRPERRLTLAEVARLIAAAEGTGEGYAELVTVLAWSGRRPVAVFAATAEDCARLLDDDLDRAGRLMHWSRDKAGVGRGWGPVPQPAYVALRARAEAVGSGPLWWSPTGRPWTAGLWGHYFGVIAERAKVLDVVPYDLRRFACTQLVQALGGNLPAARAYTGHRRDETLMRYVYAPRGLAEDMAGAVGWPAPELREAGHTPGTPDESAG